ncbi:HNH endonuclease signature motif containing protein [Kribbella speibonae]|uniref:HNH endonuclease n=1 Tax=Kribbella speibonae TaxID=1572660 RepID=A0ABY2A8W2_9ACTN|nr:HNH endonuclease signature motif containing protein [Kribbella speibonae]TCC25507.1 HNH endonuclease [Kribbella speibonae]
MGRVAVDLASGASHAAGPIAADLGTAVVAGALVPPDDVYDLDDLYDPEGLHPPRLLSEEDLYDDLPPMSRVDGLEWELWAGVEQDEAEREMLRLKAPPWVFLPPGAELAAALEELRPQCESPTALIEAIKAASRMEAWTASIKTTAIASFVRQRKAQASEIPRPTQIDSSGRPIDPERSWAAEVGAALRLSTNTAARHIDTALHLTGTLPATHSALRCGALTWSKALAISEATRHLPDESARAVEAHVLRRAPGQTHAGLGKSLRRQVAKHAAKEEADRHQAALAERTCKIVPLADGMAGLWVVHTADQIQRMWVVIQAMADLAKRDTPAASTTADSTTTTGNTTSSTTTSSTDASADASDEVSRMGAPAAAANTRARTPGAAGLNNADGSNHIARPNHTVGAWEAPASPAPAPQNAERQRSEIRSAEQRRADSVADLFGHMLHNGLDWLGRRLPDQHRRRPHIEVLIPITTLLGMDDDPCELAGYGPIPAGMARRIAADGTWRRLLTDPANGAVLEASTTRHDPGALVSETLLARHPVCAWPGCSRASRQCDRDHTTPFAQSGQTSLTGMVPYCEYHHVIKDTKAWGWSTTAHADGSVTLTTPTGHRYTTVPPARGPITSSEIPPTADPPPF